MRKIDRQQAGPGLCGECGAFDPARIKDACLNCRRRTMDHLERVARDTKEFDLDNYNEAVRLVRDSGKVSISFIQRRLKLGLNRAARIVETMEFDGLITAPDSKGVRNVVDA